MERHFLLSVPLILPLSILLPDGAEIFMTSHLLWWNIILVISILMKKKDLKREKDIIGLLEVTVTEGYLMKGYDSR